MGQHRLVKELKTALEQAKVKGWTQHCEKHGTTHPIDFCFERHVTIVRVLDCQEDKCPYHFRAAVPAIDTPEEQAEAEAINRRAEERRLESGRDLYWLRQRPGSVLKWWAHEPVKDFIVRLRQHLAKVEKVTLKKAS
jgi:hypothetical protein